MSSTEECKGFIDPATLLNHNMSELESGLQEDVLVMLKAFTADCARDLAFLLMEDIIEDVKECSDFANGCYTDSDIKLAIGRVLFNRLA